uniref:Subtilisin-like protease fibronectin type-III domain-containing protein n=1 Tax=Fagus sylvatica TaxID=28930 RepID=A0A2N9HU45_FAGSY
MGSLPKEQYSPLSNHLSMLQEVIEDSSVEDSLVRSYKRSSNGFAAKLTERERQRLANRKEVVSVFPSNKLPTSHNKDLGTLLVYLRRSKGTPLYIESDIIVGVFDTGIWPESESFNDEGFGPPPKKWKGFEKSLAAVLFATIVGAQYYSSLSNERIAQGTARGGVPSAGIAVYRVCYAPGCTAADILAAFDDAIADGVDIISASLGPTYPDKDLSENSVAIGAFHAMEKGILTSQAAGNRGPKNETVTSQAPWVLSVAASSTDRQIVDKVVLGNGMTLDGFSINGFSSNQTKFPLIDARNGSVGACSDNNSGFCDLGCLDSRLITGKIVLCDKSYGDTVTDESGAVGAILRNNPVKDAASIAAIPTLILSVDNHAIVTSYINSTKDPHATILKSEAIKDGDAPEIALFSSRGPNIAAPEILKPDITAPGTEILAAYSPIVSLTFSSKDNRRVKYGILSGTSISCPHASGVAVYIKTFHPDWSVSAIKSAIMTTGAEFAYGSGHINPTKAVDPGLVYEAFKEDYIMMLCGMGYNETKLKLISGDNNITCSEASTKALPRDLNYPSMTALVNAKTSFNVTFHRTVTNVGFANSTYKATTFTNSDVKIVAVPEVLSFKSLNEKKSFVVSVTGGPSVLPTNSSMASSSLVWSDGSPHDQRLVSEIPFNWCTCWL